MADQKSIEKELKEIIKKEKEALNDVYGDILHRLKDEREKLQKEIRNEYENARTYVKKNPESGVGVALVGGLIAGVIISKFLSK
ncbi:MAG: hypothetical protein WEA56_01390 [Balneolaceae bacterium]